VLVNTRHLFARPFSFAEDSAKGRGASSTMTGSPKWADRLGTDPHLPSAGGDVFNAGGGFIGAGSELHDSGGVVIGSGTREDRQKKRPFTWTTRGTITTPRASVATICRWSPSWPTKPTRSSSNDSRKRKRSRTINPRSKRRPVFIGRFFVSFAAPTLPQPMLTGRSPPVALRALLRHDTQHCQAFPCGDHGVKARSRFPAQDSTGPFIG